MIPILEIGTILEIVALQRTVPGMLSVPEIVIRGVKIGQNQKDCLYPKPTFEVWSKYEQLQLRYAVSLKVWHL